MDYTQILGGIAAALSIVGVIPYIYGMLRGKTRPHIFSWFLWGGFNGMAGLAQVADGGGPGAWVNLASAILCWMIAVMGLFQKGERDIARSDWYAFIGALLALIPWAMTKDPLWSVVMITFIDMLAFYPTFRKGWAKPYEDNVTAFSISAVKHAIGLAALTHYSVTTVLFSASLVLTNTIFVLMILYRRRKAA